VYTGCPAIDVHSSRTCFRSHKLISESQGIAPRILDLGTRRRWVVSFTPRPLYPQGKSPWYPSDRRLGGPQSRSGRGGEEKNSEPPPGLEPSSLCCETQRHSQLHADIYPFYCFLSVLCFACSFHQDPSFSDLEHRSDISSSRWVFLPSSGICRELASSGH
jgi:hypothetical protein